MLKRLLFSLLLLSAGPLAAAAEPDLAPVRRWLAKQEELRTLQADFTQTRSYKNLRDPLASPGHLWYSAPGAFRWEIGDPPKTVVLRKGENYYVITPGKKRAERTAAASGSAASARQMPMMEFPFARNFDDFNRRFEVVSLATDGTRCRLQILPRDPQARDALASIRLDFDMETGHLGSFEFVTHDGSSLRNEFTNVHDNAKIDPRQFDYDFTGYEVVDAK